MDSITSAAKYLFLFLPVETLCRVVEWIGTAYGILQYSFFKGKCKSRAMYDYLER